MMASYDAIFVDASAVVAIVEREPGWQNLASRLDQAEQRLTSPLAIWEATNAMERLHAWDFDSAQRIVSQFLETMEITTIDVTAAMGEEALRAAKLYGKGRHPARLNFGDCFAYACAKVLNVPLLCKGDDFPRTDILLA